VFETWVIGEVLKARLAAGLTPNLYYYRDHHGTEVDLVIEDADTVTLIECKSGATVGADYFSSLDKVAAIIEASGVSRKVQRLVIYGGDASQSRSSGRVVPWHKAGSIAL
jgi:predicted AAA+ superfamily ATPase